MSAVLYECNSGPSWQAVAQVHRDAYGVAGTLVALAIFLSGATDSLDKVGAMSHVNTPAIRRSTRSLSL